MAGSPHRPVPPRGCADPGVTVVAARAVPGWHSCAVPESGSPAAGGPRRGADAAASRPFGQVAERSFYCRSCRLAARGRWIPAGWYVLERAAGGGGRHLRVGLYCSLGCLAAAAGGDLAEAEQDAGAWHGLPAGAARGRARLVEIAQTLLHQGATIRAAGDELGVPTSALRHWLREAGVRVGADGTLTGSAAPVPPGKDKDGAAHGIAAGPRTPAPAASGSPPAPAAAGGPPARAGRRQRCAGPGAPRAGSGRVRHRPGLGDRGGWCSAPAGVLLHGVRPGNGHTRPSPRPGHGRVESGREGVRRGGAPGPPGRRRPRRRRRIRRR